MCNSDLFSDYMLKIFKKNGYTPSEVFENAEMTESDAYNLLFSEGIVSTVNEGTNQNIEDPLERVILESLGSGVYDKCSFEVKDDNHISGLKIRNGVPIRYIYETDSEKGGVTKKLYEKRYSTDEEKLYFMGEYGFIKETFNDYPEIGHYSNLFYKDNSVIYKEEKNND